MSYSNSVVGDLGFWGNGPQPGGFYQFNANAHHDVPSTHPKMRKYGEMSDPYAHTTSPTVTGTSVLAIAYNGGVCLAADMLGSYGSLAKMRSETRFKQVGSNTIVGGSGDLADFQYISHLLDALVTENECEQDGHGLTPKAVHSYLTRILYNRRSKMNPLWNTLVVAGVEKGQIYLGYVDKIGVAYKDPTIATGFGNHLARPLLRTAYESNPNMTAAEAEVVIDRCLKVLFYRDGRSLNKFQIAHVNADGVQISGPRATETNWDVARLVSGYE